MTHFFAGPEQVSDGMIRITGPDYNHMKNVLRMKPGEELSVSDGPDRRCICRIEAYTDSEAVLRIIDIEGASAELPAEITLFQGIPKGEKFELILQKSVELGVSRIVPVSMARCVAKIDPKKEEKKIERFRKIAESAAKQSGRDRIPEVTSVMTLKETAAFAKSRDMRLIFAYEKAENPEDTRRIFDSVRPGQKIGIVIGPEGGFSAEEAEFLQDFGAETVTLGKRILRTETAPLYLLSVLGYRLEFCAEDNEVQENKEHGNLS